MRNGHGPSVGSSGSHLPYGLGLQLAIVDPKERGRWSLQLPVRSPCLSAPWRRARRERRSLQTLHALNLSLRLCMSAKEENAMVRNNQLPGWQQMRLSRLPDRYTADPVPNSEKRERNGRSLKGHWGRRCQRVVWCCKSRLKRTLAKLATCVERTDAAWIGARESQTGAITRVRRA